MKSIKAQFGYTLKDIPVAHCIIFLSCFVLAFVAGSFVIVPQGTKAVTGLGLVAAPTMSLATSTNNVDVAVTPTAAGALASASHSLTASTNVPTGYNLVLAGAATPSLTPSSGTFASPVVLANNTWGYAVPGVGGFDVSYAAPVPSAASRWASPVAATTIKNTAVSAVDDVTTVYYGVKADLTQASGTYVNAVQYTATANISTVPVPTIISITPNQGTIEGGTAIQIVGTGFTVNDQSVTTAVTLDGLNCANVSISSNTPATGQDTVYCDTPAHAVGVVDVAVVTWQSTATLVNGYTYKIPIASMQEITQGTCPTTRTLTYDARDYRTYWVQKLADGRCWMLTNLAYAGGGANTYGDVHSIIDYDTIDPNDEDRHRRPWYFVPPGANPTDYPATPSVSTDGGVTNPQYGYLYNRCAVHGGIMYETEYSSYCDYDEDVSICPYNWRLPHEDEYRLLNYMVNDGLGTTVAGLRVNWLFMYGGSRSYGGHGEEGFYYTPDRSLRYEEGYPNNYLRIFSNSGDQYAGFSLRCIIDAPSPQAGSFPRNLSATNPAVIDVYPTTGWEGDTVTITSNALFTNVQSVTIGGTACLYNVISTSVISCRLPAKIAGTSNDIAVINAGVDVTSTTTYAHMKITYFDPAATTVTIGGVTYDLYSDWFGARDFRSSDCAAMVASNVAIGSTPAASMIYLRDTSDNQVYRVKKMIDGKCWIVDNIKSIAANDLSSSSGVGFEMTYNNGDHLNNGGIGAYNTVDESSTQSTENSDKAFYNNPMGDAYCYGAANMPVNTLTHCGYLYNWYAATAKAGTYSANINGDNSYYPYGNVSGICPENFRLPSAMSDGLTPTSSGTSYGAADFPVLNASMNAGVLTAGSVASYPAGWQPSGAWGGVFSGVWGSSFVNQGSFGDFWSSTVNSAADARNFYFNSNSVFPGNESRNKYFGYAVRCVME